MRTLFKTKWRIFLFGLTVVMMSATAYAFLGGLKWTGTFETAVQKLSWEYRAVALSATSGITDGSFENELNQLGSDGWELGALVTTQSGGYYIMKRMRTS